MNATEIELPAPLFRRLMSILYDAIVIIGLLIVGLALVIVPLGMAIGKEEWELVRETTWMRTLTQLLALSIVVGFHVGFWRHGGQTIGMRAWRLQVRRADGESLSLGDALTRYAAAWLSAVALGIGFTACLWDKQHLTWHDKVSRTRLILLPTNTCV
jgi:uncharacterized RDD family membrane protein YckC